MGAKEKKKSAAGQLSKEEWGVRYDILHHSLWIVVKCLFLLDILWYLLFRVSGYGQWKGMLVETMAVPVLLTCLAGLFEACFWRFKLPLDDYIVMLILNLTALLVLTGDHWSHSMQFICILPVIFCMILGPIRLVYFQITVSAAMTVIQFAVIEMRAPEQWKDDIRLNLSGIMFNFIVIARIIVQIRKYTQMLDTQTTIDSLTRLHNHEAFYEELDSRVAEYGAGQKPLSILIADIDNFKRVNDTYGHAYGDQVLKVLAGIFSDAESKKCFAARYGGEEFAMIMELDQSEAVTKAQMIRKRFEEQKIPTDEGQENSFTVSVGVAAYRPEYKTSSQFFEKADEALYKAKAGGKNRICL